MTKVVGRDEAVQLLRDGVVVAVPTDTVYGVAASLLDDDAIAQIFLMKRRPVTVALPVLVDSRASIEALGVTWPEKAQRLSDAFWPGALTIVVDVTHELALRVRSNSDSVGFRIPNDTQLLEVLEATGPLVVSSANEHGLSPCHSVGDVLGTFGEHQLLEAVLDGGERRGDVSTVIAIHDDSWRILRHGAVSDDAIVELFR
jgi:L-threonylcarbamoyladenylate synthase